MFKKLFNRNKKVKSAHLAKERLKVLVEHERNSNIDPEWVIKMRNEILAVLEKYPFIKDESLNIELREDNGLSILEINVDIPANGVDN